MSATKEKTCEDRVEASLRSTMDDLRRLLDAEYSGEEYVEDLGSLNEYGLCVDYVAPGTFSDQNEGFVRYQLSTGGPGTEFRFFVSPSRHGYAPYRIEYWFLDWFDGAHRVLSGDDHSTMCEIFEQWDDCGMVEQWIEDSE